MDYGVQCTLYDVRRTVYSVRRTFSGDLISRENKELFINENY